ncbi:probable nucleoredoxin 1 [Cucurbita maxima]|uniref:protein-disulfide reductase n=1 Tax=Cucurbita maxima TaxID=3661 RepID=A0A6J1L1K0_CUCMA|nr:probable nucleoredoxin 1 [Cucurbita maxima]XP_023007757.1 probable nucleoredoxin 1 [Cucurbita maxima]
MNVDEHDGLGGVAAHGLHSEYGDFLLRNNGDKVDIEMLKGKNLGLYFSAAWCGPCQRFTPSLVEAYNELSSKGKFEIIFVSADDDEKSFNEYFSKMPWLAIPFSDSERRDRLDSLFQVSGIPHLIILDNKWELSTDSGVDFVREYGAKAYPFTPDRIAQLASHEAMARREQSLRSIMVSSSRDFVISSKEEKVPVTKLEGKVVGLYFSMFSYERCMAFTPKLVDAYEKLKAKGERFEIVLISLDQDEELFKQGLRNIPWLALPFIDKRCDKLVRYFEISTLPTLVIIGRDGRTLQSNVVNVVEEHGFLAYPFTKERFAELAKLEKEKEEAQTLESVLVSGDRDFVIENNGTKVPVSSLVGKNILIYFSADWCPPCRAFLPKLIETHHNIKKKKGNLEVIFISCDKDEVSFEKLLSRMPWLAIPFGDQRKALIRRKFKVQMESIPVLICIGADGRTVTNDATQLVSIYGAKAYPFSTSRAEELKSETELMTWNLPQNVKHVLHEGHLLSLTSRKGYVCDGCEKEGRVWSYCCKRCDFDLHPECALEKNPEYQMDKWRICG